MDELKEGESQAAESSEEAEADAADAAPAAEGDGLDVSLETPGPGKLDSYLVPPPVADEPPNGETPEPESDSATNLAYEDLLEKLVLPATPAAPDEAEAVEEPPPFASPGDSEAQSSSSPLANLFPPSAQSIQTVTDERTVVTANPLLAEEQEAAAREAENFILPAAPVATPVFAESPIGAPPVRAASLQSTGMAPSKFIQISYPMFGFMMLAAVLVGGVLSRLMAPTRTVVSQPPVQAPTLVARPVVPAQPTQAANPAPQVVPLPTPTEAPTPVPPAAEPAATAEARPSGEIPTAEPMPVESAGEPRAAAKPRVHHAAKAPRPPKSVAPKAAPAKPAAPKPVAPKKPAKGGWVDPFAQ
jgi:hypothetical protein